MTDHELVRTRRALHAVAELVLAGPQHRMSGSIELRVSAGGFRTTAEPDLAVVGTDLVGNGVTSAISGRTARELGAALGVVAGAPLDVYGEGSGVALDDVLDVETTGSALIAAAYRRGDAALRLLSPDTEPVLWPEHFDIGIRVDDVNFGVSPGDSYLAEPYAYVGASPVPAHDPWWNAPFGVALPLTSLVDVHEVHDFFVDARTRLQDHAGSDVIP